MKTIAFFHNKGGVGKTTLVYHLAWMFADRGIPTLAVDLDPQANLTAMFLKESRIEDIWPDGHHRDTVYGSISPILRGIGDISKPHTEYISENLYLVPGDLALSSFEDKLSDAWPRCHNTDEAAFRIISAFYRLIRTAAEQHDSQLVLINVGPNLGAINRSSMIAVDQVILPLAPDLFSLQGLKNLGPTLREWRSIWHELLKKAPKNNDLPLPEGKITPIGYVVLQHGIRDNRPVLAYMKWMKRIPAVFRESVLGESPENAPTVDDDQYNLSVLKHYRSLMPMAMEARKPMFFLRPNDGAIGSHMEAVNSCYNDFLKLAKIIAQNAGVNVE